MGFVVRLLGAFVLPKLIYLCFTAVIEAQALASSLLTLQGAGAYDAAVHCASVSAARRLLQQQQLGVTHVQQGPRNALGYRCVYCGARHRSP